MERDNITPEEKLLNIIESPDINRNKIVPSRDKKGLQKNKVFAWTGKINFDKKIIKFFELRFANKALFVLCGVFTLLGVFDFVKLKINLNGRLNEIKIQTVSAGKKEIPIMPEIDITGLLKDAAQRNIFSFIPPKENAVSEYELPVRPEYKLVGIIWSDTPQAMLENPDAQKTYLLSEGEQIDKITVKKIFKNKIILASEEEEWELR